MTPIANKALVVSRTEMDVVQTAGAIKLTFTLRQDSEEKKELSLAWEREFINNMVERGDDFFTFLVRAFSSSQSLGTELDKGTKGTFLL